MGWIWIKGVYSLALLHPQPKWNYLIEYYSSVPLVKMPSERIKTPHPAKTRKTKPNTTHNQIIMCKVYSNGCGHCIRLAPKWEQMKTILGDKVAVKDIEDVNMDSDLKKLKEEYGIAEDIKVDGYPTIFRIENGVSYYGGNREPKDMANWAISGKSQPVLRGGAKKKHAKKSRKQIKTKKVRFFGLL